MVKKNDKFSLLAPNYLFPEIQKRKTAFLEKFPGKQLISLGIGDTTQPLPNSITDQIAQRAKELSTENGYSGYGPEQGSLKLRQAIVNTFYENVINEDEIFISDGAKCDTGRLLHLFNTKCTIAVQDPTYPVYVDTSIITDKGGKILYLPCKPENNFFPDLEILEEADIIFFCSPNNPTGTVTTKEQLQQLVVRAKKKNALIIFDAAYSFFIKDPSLPRSIYEIEEAKEVAIEINSFSKLAGFTGLRLGWAVVPKELTFNDGSSVHQAWNRITTTFFNGASSLAQAGGIAALSEEGLQAIAKHRDYYLENASLILKTLKDLGYKTYGGTNSPYVWVDFSPKSSWEMFDQLLHQAQVISIPGKGFGEAGEGFLRFSAFAKREEVIESMHRMAQLSKIH